MGHVLKQIGCALLQYKKDMKGWQLQDGKGVRGTGRLTQDTIKKIQNYCGVLTEEVAKGLQKF